jgi:hypothetical protein
MVEELENKRVEIFKDRIGFAQCLCYKDWCPANKKYDEGADQYLE